MEIDIKLSQYVYETYKWVNFWYFVEKTEKNQLLLPKNNRCQKCYYWFHQGKGDS